MKTEMQDKPENMTNDHLDYLDYLRESGVTNMFGAAPFLQRTYPELSITEARAILSYWMKNFKA